MQGTKQRVRSETFADHYSQARQFWISQTETEQRHIAAGLTFELSKCEHEHIRLRMLSHLRVVHDDLAEKVAEGLGVTDMPAPAIPAREPIIDLSASDALSILKNGPCSLAGRKLGLHVSDGADADLVTAVETAFQDEGQRMAKDKPSLDFVSDAFAHAKFIGWTDAAKPLLKAAGVTMDDGMVDLTGEGAADFVTLCRKLRHWPRETA